MEEICFYGKILSMGDQFLLPTVIGSGLIDSFNPCAISAALIFVAVMFTLKKERKVILTVGIFYILSIYITYFLIGLGLLRAFNLFGVPHIIPIIGATFVTIFGLLNIKEYFFPNWNFLKIRMSINARHKISDWAHKATVPAAIVVGVLVAIFEFPCSGAVYVAILSLLSLKQSFFGGALYLLIYNLMFVLPLILIFALSSNRMVVEGFINMQEKDGRKMHLSLAVLMLSLGAAMFYLYL
ncbi:hypothetical protein HGB13_01720 [bacterium]|nr:hypothetical protein [bacterium]